MSVRASSMSMVVRMIFDPETSFSNDISAVLQLLSIVILSGAGSLRSEVPAESKDPYTGCGGCEVAGSSHDEVWFLIQARLSAPGGELPDTVSAALAV